MVAGASTAAAGRVVHAQVQWPAFTVMEGPRYGDTPGACAELAAAERARMAHRPITEMDVYRGMGDAFGTMILLRWASVLPSLGVQAQRDARVPGLSVSWPFSLPFGPVTACNSARGGGVDEFRPLRLALEPGLVVRSTPVLFLRPGVRAIWHHSQSRVGVGAGLGSTLAWSDGAGVAASISPELLVHLGRCCRPGYLLVTVRADRYFPRRQADTLTATVGLAFW